MHENGEYQKAIEINTPLLKDAEQISGAESEKLFGVIKNLAQNHYCLQQFDATKRYLQQRLSIATKLGADYVIDDTLFQLGVLAHEQGDKKAAKAIFDERLKHAQAIKDDDLIEEVKHDLTMLTTKVSSASSCPVPRS